MIYFVSSRDQWTKDLRKRFGNTDQQHNLTDEEVVEAIVIYGRAEIIKNADGTRSLSFHNDSDEPPSEYYLI